MIFTGINILLFCLVSIFIGLSTFISYLFPKWLFYCRKALHISVLSCLALSINFLSGNSILEFGFFLIVCELILIIFVLRGFFVIDNRRSWGIIYFLPPIICLLLAFPQNKFEIAVSVWILALSDGFSAILGRLFDFEKWKTLNTIHWGLDRKTFIGSLVFFFTSVGVFFYFGVFKYSWMVFFASFFLTAIELICGRGSDNFFLPICSFFFILFLKNTPVTLVEIVSLNIPFLILFIPLFFIVLRFKWLSTSGLIFAVYLASISLITDTSLLPLVVFFMLGTLAGRLNKTQRSDVKHNKSRDAFQVLANGGVVLMLMVAHEVIHEFISYQFFVLISIAVACSDTLSSEIGMRFGKKTYHILTFKPIEKGVSGGVSIPGFLGAIFGSSVIAFFDLNHFLLILFWGILGSVIDSLLGVLFQAKYLNQGVLTDRPTNQLVGGFRFVSNDLVNFVSNLITVLLALWMV